MCREVRERQHRPRPKAHVTRGVAGPRLYIERGLGPLLSKRHGLLTSDCAGSPIHAIVARRREAREATLAARGFCAVPKEPIHILTISDRALGATGHEAIAILGGALR